jgi:Spy/CpxP family protein refolding chaperone
MKRVWFLLLALSVGLNAGLIATRTIGDGGHRPHEKPRPPEQGGPGGTVDNHLAAMTEHLGLDEAQQTAVRAVLESGLPQIAERQGELRKLEGLTRGAYGAPRFDADEFSRLVAQAAAARAVVDSLTAAMLVQEATILSPDQRRRFAEVAQGLNGRRPADRGRTGVGPHPPGPPPVHGR